MKRTSSHPGNAVSRLAAALLFALTLPVWLVRVLAALPTGGRVTFTSCWGDAGRFSVLTIISQNGYRRYLWLLTIITGDMGFVGPAPGFSADTRPGRRPGLASPSRLRRTVGIGHQNGDRDDEVFFESATNMQYAGLLTRYAMSGLLSIKSPIENNAQRIVELFGVAINAMSMPQAVAQIIGYCGRAQHASTKIVSFVNPDCLNKASTDREYHYLLNRTDIVLPDGSGLRIAAKLLGLPMYDNVNGTDLFPLLCDEAARSGQRLFLYGGRPGIARRAADAMQARFPALKIVGCLDGFEHQDDVVIREINASGADIVLVGLGAPRQEKWLNQHRRELIASVGIGVGGLFDYYSGNIKRAPLWLREIGLEWTWRILQEPGAKWRRYVLGNPLFLLRVLREGWVRHRGFAGRRLEQALPTPAELSVLTTPSAQHRFTSALVNMRLWQAGLAIRSSGKRALDVVVSVGALIALSPLLLITTIAIRLESPGPIFFRQVRVGARGRTFSMLKFRSMFVDAEVRLAELQQQNESADGVLFKMKDDPRITRVGRLIRRFSIDELPQIINVLRGDMAIVGPRPALPTEVAQYASPDRKRLQAKPGLTCLWQIGGRSDLSFEQQVQLDIDYMRKQGLLTDLRIIAKTVPAVLSGKGAY